MPQPFNYTIKARTWPIWAICALSGIPGAVILITEPLPKAGLLLLGASVVFGLLLWAFSRAYKIQLDEKALCFSAFGRKKVMTWNEMTQISIEWTPQGLDAAGPVWIYRSASGGSIQIPLGYYSRSDLQLLARTSIDLANTAACSSSIDRIAAGNFPWYLF